ncbi:MAG: hypothetical protein EX272_07035 [Chromatiales bacterium]|nr:MAG: hypothetical protein EX272_07035 [Chromatiales bacterium]
MMRAPPPSSERMRFGVSALRRSYSCIKAPGDTREWERCGAIVPITSISGFRAGRLLSIFSTLGVVCREGGQSKGRLQAMRETRSAAVLALVIGTAIAASVLGFWGYMDVYPVSSPATFTQAATEVLNNAWRTISLFLGQASLDAGQENLKLAIARILAPAATAGVILELLAEFIGTRINVLRAMRRKGHTIIVGCGERGQFFLTDSRCAMGARPVVIDRLENPAIRQAAHSAGALFFAGDARNKDLLATAGVSRAKRLIILTGNDEENLAVLSSANAVRRAMGDDLEIIIRIDNALLARQLNRDDEFSDSTSADVTVFNVSGCAARNFFDAHPLVDHADLRAQRRVHLVCLGWTPFVLAVLEQLARLAPFRDFPYPTVSLLVHDEGAVRDELTALQPALPDLLDIDIRRLEKASNIPTDEQLAAIEPGPDHAVTAVLVSTGADAATAAAALAIRDRSQQSGRWRAPVYAHLDRHGTLSGLLGERSKEIDPSLAITPVGFTEDMCRLDAIYGEREQLAECIHKSYLRLKGVDVSTPSSDRAENDQDWSMLKQTFRASSRRAADHLPVKLLSASIIREAEKLVASSALKLGSTEDELEHLADLEHQSWIIGRLLDGWKPGVRCDSMRRHPALIPYAELPEDLKEFDRDQVRVLADYLSGGRGEPTVRREVRIGLLGHNKVSQEDKSNILEQLDSGILSDILVAHEFDCVSLCTPFAPGSDMILAEALHERLSARCITHRVIVLRPLPPQVLVDSFMAGNHADDEWQYAVAPPDATGKPAEFMLDHLSSFPESIPGSFIADMTPPGLTADSFASNPDLKTVAFERAAAWMVERCDILIAFFDPSRGSGRGGTRHTLDWAHGNNQVPEHVSTLSPGQNAKLPRVHVIQPRR